MLRNRRPSQLFSSQLTQADADRFEHALGESTGQQVWESLSVLVALRCWRSLWRESRMILHVRGDSVAMLTVVLKLKPAQSAEMGLIAREVALELAESPFSLTGCRQCAGGCLVTQVGSTISAEVVAAVTVGCGS